MKEAIIGYITGIINNHLRIVESLKEFHYPKQQIIEHQNYINELNDLLDFVEDSKEEKSYLQKVELIPDKKKDEEILYYRKKIKGMAEDISNRGDRISELRDTTIKYIEENEKLRSKIAEREKTNSKLMQQNESIGRTCNSLFKENKEIKEKLEGNK